MDFDMLSQYIFREFASNEGQHNKLCFLKNVANIFWQFYIEGNRAQKSRHVNFRICNRVSVCA